MMDTILDSENSKLQIPRLPEPGVIALAGRQIPKIGRTYWDLEFVYWNLGERFNLSEISYIRDIRYWIQKTKSSKIYI